MKSVGEILSEERKKQHKTLEDISLNTKISVNSLSLLEKNNFDLLPPEPFVKGFIRNYAQELLLDPEKILAVFRRDHTAKLKNKFIPKGVARPLDEDFLWSPKYTGILFFVLVFVIISGFLFLQLKSYLFAPALALVSPQDGEIIHSKSTDIKGKTIPDAAVYINDQLISVGFDGNFTYTIDLMTGDNVIKIKAVNRSGKQTEVKRSVTVDKND